MFICIIRFTFFIERLTYVQGGLLNQQFLTDHNDFTHSIVTRESLFKWEQTKPIRYWSIVLQCVGSLSFGLIHIWTVNRLVDLITKIVKLSDGACFEASICFFQLNFISVSPTRSNKKLIAFQMCGDKLSSSREFQAKCALFCASSPNANFESNDRVILFSIVNASSQIDCHSRNSCR